MTGRLQRETERMGEAGGAYYDMERLNITGPSLDTSAISDQDLQVSQHLTRSVIMYFSN